MKTKIIATLMLCALSLTAAAQETYEVTINTPERYGLVPKGFVASTFKLWVPDGATPKYILFWVPLKNSSLYEIGGGWRNFAKEHHLAFLTAGFQPQEGKSGPSNEQVAQWSGKLMLDALKKLAAEAGQPELADAPLLLVGFHSSSAVMACNFTTWKPERVAAVITHGAFFDEAKNAYKVPCLLMEGGAGELEKFRAGRRYNAPWCRVPNKNAPEQVLKNFFTSVIAQRQSAKDESWIGNLKDKSIAPADADKPASTKDTVWLPDEDFARTWQLFVGGKE